MREDRGKELKVKIRALQALSDISNAQMAVYLRMSERSYARRMQAIENMKVKDLLKIERVLHTELLNVGGTR